jgi:hypothetical protein
MRLDLAVVQYRLILIALPFTLSYNGRKAIYQMRARGMLARR